MPPSLYTTPNVLHNPAEPATGAFKPVPPPSSPAAAMSAQKKMMSSGIQTTKAAYVCGVKEACAQLGLTKEAANPLRAWFRRILEGPKGNTVIKVPLQALLGGAAGAVAGQIHSDAPGTGAALGATSVGLRGLAVDYAPEMRKALLRSLRR